MKQFSKAFLGTAIVFATSTAVAGYDEFDCRFSGNLKLTHLQCVSCGAQKYFAKKAPNREVVPSEKWMALLGTSAVQNFALGENKTDTVVTSPAAKENYQKIVISMLRTYGFCQNYSNPKGAPKDPQDSDVRGDDWTMYIYPATTRSSGQDKKFAEKLGKYFGFDDSFWGWDAGEKMNFLIAGSPEPIRNSKDEKFNSKYPLYTDQKYQEKRARFKDRLAQAFPNEYDISGERKTDVKKMIASKDKANGLDTCLEEVNRMQKGVGDPLLNSFLNSPAENQEFCKSMANACDIKLDFCTGSKGSEHQTQPKPFSNPTPPGLKKQPSSGGGSGVR